MSSENGLKVIELKNHIEKDSIPNFNNDIFSENEQIEETIMKQDSYSKSEIDLKFENIEQKIDNKFELLSQKVDNSFANQSLKIENLLLSFKEDLNKEKEENKKWLIGISVGSLLSIIGIIISIITILSQK